MKIFVQAIILEILRSIVISICLCLRTVSTILETSLVKLGCSILGEKKRLKNILSSDKTTEGNDEYSLFEALFPGIVIRVNASNEVQIALTSFNFTSSPIIEIFIGATNNTRSIIRTNQDIDVVTLATPNIIARNQWNDFRVSWLNDGIIVYSGDSHIPLMNFTMQDSFPINYYGVRAV